MTVHAVFQNGVFRPLELVDLPENSNVEFEPRVSDAVNRGLRIVAEEEAIARIYEVLAERYHSGEHDIAERHNEHQP